MMQMMDLKEQVDHKSAHQHMTRFDSDTSDSAALPIKLTISEYEDIATRLEDSLKQLELVKDALDTPENLCNLRVKVEEQCERIAVRARIIKHHSAQKHVGQPGIMTDIFKIELLDVCKRAHLLLKHPVSRQIKFEADDTFLIDKIKLVINKKSEIVLISTSLTVFRVESDDTFTAGSMELSQKHMMREEMDNNDPEPNNLKNGQKVNNVKNGYPQNGKHNSNRNGFHMNGDEEDRELRRIQEENITMIEMEQDKFTKKRQFGQNFIDTNGPNGTPQMYPSAKHIETECKRLIQQENEKIGYPQELKQLWGFKDLLTWKVPENLGSNSTRDAQEKCELRKSRNDTCFVPPVHLYKLDLVTQRVKEQRVSFCGIVTHIKHQVDKNNKDRQGNCYKNGDQELITSQVELEAIEDKSRVILFVKHSSRIDLKSVVLKNYVLFVKDALRKISNKIDIYIQMKFSPEHIRVIGQVKEEINDFAANNSVTLIKSIPTDKIVRYIVKVCGFIVDHQFIKIQYRCDVCRAEIQNENVCRNGCFIKNPQLQLQVLCHVQDGTSKASLELKNERAIKAFNITQVDQTAFKEYCLRYGTFQHPSSTHNFQYREILGIFRKFQFWTQMIFYCKPYAKVSTQSERRGLYSETIARPSFLLQEKEKEVYLNGEVNTQKKTQGFGEQGRQIKKTMLCMKALMVDENLAKEAIRKAYIKREKPTSL